MDDSTKDSLWLNGEPEPLLADACVVPLSRADWERKFDQNVKLGFAKPGDTYSDYLRSVGRVFGIVCLGQSHD